MAVGYKIEQAEPKQESATISKKIEEMDMRVVIRAFSEQTKEYAETENSRPKIVRKIEVFRKAQKYSHTAGAPYPHDIPSARRYKFSIKDYSQNSPAFSFQ